MADPFEEFEFKPLTEGLGFHKKADKLKSDIKSTMSTTSQNLQQTPKRSSIFPETNETPFAMTPMSTPMTSPTASAPASRTASQSISDLMASLPPSLDFLDEKQDLSRPQIFQPLAREDYRSTIATGPSVTSVLPAPGTKAGGTFTPAPTPAATMAAGAIAAPLSAYSARMEQGFEKAFPKDKNRTKKITPAVAAEEGLVPVSANFSAGLIDAMVVAGVSTIFLVCIITITHINLVAMLSNAKTDGPTQMNLAFLFFAVLQMYMLVSRAFFGASLGEWAFDLQLGTSAQNKSMTYPLQTLLRMIVITLTGIFAIPLLSFAFGRDLGRYVSGLQLYRRV